MKVGAYTSKALSHNQQASENVKYQEGDGYLNDLRLESFGHLLADYVLQGGELSVDTEDVKKISLSEGIISFEDQLWRAYKSSFRVSGSNTTYYAGFISGKGYTFGITEPKENYIRLWSVNTDDTGNIETLNDLRGDIGHVKFKAVYDGFI